MNPSFLFVHQSVEQYGSDKSFVAAVSTLLEDADESSVVLLPGHGAIEDLFQSNARSRIRCRHLWILRKSELLQSVTTQLPANIRAIYKAWKDLKRYRVIYINTAVVVDFLLASFFTRKAPIVHVREIPVGLAMTLIRSLLIGSRARVIFNSNATLDAFALPKTSKLGVVYNGFREPQTYAKPRLDSERKLEILCIGRLNSWKGQPVLVDAIALLSKEERNLVNVRIVGGVYSDQEHFRSSLKAKIAAGKLENVITMSDFTDDPTDAYVNADIVVVPSTNPEPFGRVAIEGMAYSAAVIGTNHGGLTEIIKNNETGFLVTPRDPEALATAIRKYLRNRELVETHGKAGKQRFEAVFTQSASDAKLKELIYGWI